MAAESAPGGSAWRLCLYQGNQGPPLQGHPPIRRCNLVVILQQFLTPECFYSPRTSTNIVIDPSLLSFRPTSDARRKKDALRAGETHYGHLISPNASLAAALAAPDSDGT